MDITTQDEVADRRSTKRRKPGSASSFDEDPSTKPPKQTKDDSLMNSTGKVPTCDDLGYSNLPGGNGSFQSNSFTDQRQVHSFSNNCKNDCSSLPPTAFDCSKELGYMIVTMTLRFIHI